MQWVVRFSLRLSVYFPGQRLVHHEDLPGLAVQLEEHQPMPIRVWVADGQELDNQRLPGLDIDAGLRARFQPVTTAETARIRLANLEQGFEKPVAASGEPAGSP